MRKLTIDELNNTITNLGYSLIDTYWVNNFRRIVIQDRIGYKYDVFYQNLRRGQSVNFVDPSNPYTLENISLWLKINDKNFKIFQSKSLLDLL